MHGCHTELQCQLMARREACHLSDLWGGLEWGIGVTVTVCVCVCVGVRKH